jgi:hypothetical protein
MPRPSPAPPLSLAELTERHLTQGQPAPASLLRALARDERKGAQALLRRLQARERRQQEEARRLEALLRY